MTLTASLIRKIGDKQAHSREMRLCVINYHRILEVADPLLQGEPDLKTFRWQMRLLAESFNVVPLHDAVVGLRMGTTAPRSVAITFDDGYRSLYELALPILEKFNLPATVFVTTGDGSEPNMWNDRVLHSLRQLAPGLVDLRHIGLGVHPFFKKADRVNTVIALMEAIKYLSPSARMDVIQELEKLTGRSSSRDLMLTHDMIFALAEQGMEIGGHTISHPILTSLTDDEARYEIYKNKQQIEAITGKAVRLFAYPNGKVGRDFDARHVAMVKDAGYVAAFTTERGAATAGKDMYQLPRSRPWDSTPLGFGIRLLSWFSDRPL